VRCNRGATYRDGCGLPIVREEIGYAIKAGRLVVPLVAPSVAQDPALLGMLNGREYIRFDIDNPEEGFSPWQSGLRCKSMRSNRRFFASNLRSQALANQEADARQRAERQLELQASELFELQSSNDAANRPSGIRLVVGWQSQSWEKLGRESRFGEPGFRRNTP